VGGAELAASQQHHGHHETPFNIGMELCNMPGLSVHFDGWLRALALVVFSDRVGGH